jgi:hypothetical protein
LSFPAWRRTTRGGKVSDRVRRDFKLEAGMDKATSKDALCTFIRDVLQEDE